MGILNKLTGKKEEKKPAKKDENVLDMVKDEQKEQASTPKPTKQDTGRAYSILFSAHLSEKTNALSNLGRYVFKVNPKANKIEVKKAVEATYDVHVTAVNMINSPGKSRRMGRKFGRTSDWKKAIVTLKAGDKISGLTEGV